jgi:glucoamylase
MVCGRGLITVAAGAALVAGMAAAAPAASAAPAQTAAPAAQTAAAAPGAPGAPSYFDLARKDCLGTAANQGSKVWYTVAGGVLSDVYEPTIDNTDVSTLQYVVTDGATFTDLQARDTAATRTRAPTQG